MILKKNIAISKKLKTRKRYKWKAALVIIATILVALILFYFIASLVHQLNSSLIKIADAEEILDDKFHFEGFFTSGIESQSNEEAFEGKYSIKLLSSGQKSGFNYLIKDVYPGDRIEAEVWSYSTNDNFGSLIISGADKKTHYVKNNGFDSSLRNWKKLTVTYNVMDSIEDNTLNIFCFNELNTPVFFDNLAYSRTVFNNSRWTPEKLHLNIKEGEFAILKKKRNEALKQGILVTEKDSWVKGAIYPKDGNTEKIGVSLRLKGDWLDHLEGNKWSFRIKTQPDKSWKRIKTFSVQNPKTRGYLKEWVLHKFFNKEDILTPRYEFINLVCNNKNWGLYVYEEHFTKQLLEFNLRKEGPILKFSETHFWESKIHASKEGATPDSIPSTISYNILPFSESKTAASPILSAYYKTAQNLMFEYQYGLKSAKDIFDLDILAKYYAIVDITGGHHGIIWHNQRFYYNPVTSKLEPIGFDGYGNVADSWLKTSFIGENQCTKFGDKEWHKKLFSDFDFLKKYNAYLYTFSQESYIKPFLDSISESLNERTIYIKRIVPYYQYTTNYIYQRAANIRNALFPKSTVLQSKIVKPGLIAVCNRHSTALKIIGTSKSQDGQPIYLDSTHIIFTTPYGNLPDYSHQIQVPKDAQFFVFKVLGLKQLFYAKISKWPVPKAFTAAQELEGNLIIDHPNYYYNGLTKKVVFKKNTQIKQPIIIPEGHSVLIEQGSTIDLINKAFLLSYSAIKFLGSNDAPIKIISSDKTSMGIIILQSKDRSIVEYTSFTDQNTLNYKGWTQTGAITFYESDVDIRYSVFANNYCEDALNIIRSNFTFEKNTISNTFADGFDADFCTGVVNNCYFYKTGNDAIDFSTSTIEIKNTKIANAGDKGISIGEAGTSTIKDCEISSSVIGIASKDLSRVTVDNLKIKNCDIAFAAYQKKPEYGGGYIYVNSYIGEDLKTTHKILPGSFLKLLNLDINGE
ncbi:MAG: right-handed parallel beta-helix repeat-containing protein [Saprospiraceae bacterium]|nr:right-handed parallel beta-helix repeat-containing protein [Saprospiraceae bacterium]